MKSIGLLCIAVLFLCHKCSLTGFMYDSDI
jgi:hypothetical protein